MSITARLERALSPFVLTIAALGGPGKTAAAQSPPTPAQVTPDPWPRTITEQTIKGGSVIGPGGQTAGAAKVNDNYYATHEGNVYRNTGSGWQQYSNGSWNTVSRASEPQALQADAQARSAGDARAAGSAWGSSSWGDSFDRSYGGGNGWWSRGGSSGYGVSSDGWDRSGGWGGGGWDRGGGWGGGRSGGTRR